MPMQGQPTPYDPATVCRHLGQIYLESRFEIQRQAEEAEKSMLMLRQQLEQAHRRIADLEMKLRDNEKDKVCASTNAL